MYNENGEEISSDIWHGESVDKVKFWINLEIRKIIAKSDYNKIDVNIEEL